MKVYPYTHTLILFFGVGIGLEHSCKVHRDPHNHGPVYGDGASPWSKG